MMSTLTGVMLIVARSLSYVWWAVSWPVRLCTSRVVFGSVSNTYTMRCQSLLLMWIREEIDEFEQNPSAIELLDIIGCISMIYEHADPYTLRTGIAMLNDISSDIEIPNTDDALLTNWLRTQRIRKRDHRAVNLTKIRAASSLTLYLDVWDPARHRCIVATLRHMLHVTCKTKDTTLI
jgi:hypothetical protein